MTSKPASTLDASGFLHIFIVVELLELENPAAGAAHYSEFNRALCIAYIWCLQPSLPNENRTPSTPASKAKNALDKRWVVRSSRLQYGRRQTIRRFFKAQIGSLRPID